MQQNRTPPPPRQPLIPGIGAAIALGVVSGFMLVGAMKYFDSLDPPQIKMNTPTTNAVPGEAGP